MKIIIIIIKNIRYNLNLKDPFNIVRKNASKFILKCLDLGSQFSFKKETAGLSIVL